jgi:hypothetical protein
MVFVCVVCLKLTGLSQTNINTGEPIPNYICCRSFDCFKKWRFEDSDTTLLIADSLLRLRAIDNIRSMSFLSSNASLAKFCSKDAPINGHYCIYSYLAYFNQKAVDSIISKQDLTHIILSLRQSDIFPLTPISRSCYLALTIKYIYLKDDKPVIGINQLHGFRIIDAKLKVTYYDHTYTMHKFNSEVTTMLESMNYRKFRKEFHKRFTYEFY